MTQINENTMTRNMLNTLRRAATQASVSKKGIIKENNENDKKGFAITKDSTKFGDVRETQEQMLMKTIGERVVMETEGLMYYPDDTTKGNVILTASVPSIGINFQFKLNDEIGRGCYIWSNAMALNQDTYRLIGKVLDAYDIWHNSFSENTDLIDNLYKFAHTEE